MDKFNIQNAYTDVRKGHIPGQPFNTYVKTNYTKSGFIAVSSAKRLKSLALQGTPDRE